MATSSIMFIYGQYKINVYIYYLGRVFLAMYELLTDLMTQHKDSCCKMLLVELICLII